MPARSSGRRAALAAAVSGALVVVYAGCALTLNLTTGEDEDPARPLFLLLSLAFIGAIVSGLVAAVNVGIAVFRRRERGRIAIAVLAISIVLVPAVVFFIVADILGGTHEGREVTARIEGGRIELLRRQGQQDRHISEVDGPFHLVLKVENREEETQRIAIAELSSFDAQRQPVAKMDANAWPVIDGRVRHFSFPDEGGIIIWTSGGWSMTVARGVDPPPRPPDIAVDVAPGETVKLEPRYDDFPPGTTLVIFSDLPGRYEKGQRAVLEIR